jgi:hypothetical protein
MQSWTKNRCNRETTIHPLKKKIFMHAVSNQSHRYTRKKTNDLEKKGKIIELEGEWINHHVHLGIKKSLG